MYDEHKMSDFNIKKLSYMTWREKKTETKPLNYKKQELSVQNTENYLEVDLLVSSTIRESPQYHDERESVWSLMEKKNISWKIPRIITRLLLV